MKNSKYFLNTALAGVLGIALVACMAVKAFVPAVILPRVDIPKMVLISLLALLVDHLAVKNAKRCYICIPGFSLITFAVLPWAAGMVVLADVWKGALVGAGVFTLVTWLFSAMQERIASGKFTKATIFISALGLYLASQVLTGMIL